MCLHLHIIGDNYGTTCADCGEPLAGYGYWAEGSRTCIHQWEPDGEDGEICVFCQEWRPAESSHDPA